MRAFALCFGPWQLNRPSTYSDRQLTIEAPANRTSYWVYRTETESGRTWVLSNGAWREVTAK
jgi:hypothetical protein